MDREQEMTERDQVGTVEGRMPQSAAPDALRHPNNGGIACEGLRNVRDLGGMPAADGRRIAPRRLIRSDTLARATDADLALLRDAYDLRLDIDLRSDLECSELPDPVDALPRTRYVHLPVFQDLAAGVTRTAVDMEALRAKLSRGEIEPAELMIGLYPHIVLDDMGIAAYAAFFQELLAADEGAVLWHCTAGKDRCGMASVFVEVALGVPWSLIEEDYVATNRFYGIDVTACAPELVLEGVDPRFLAAAAGAINDAYGSVEGYLAEALGVDTAMRDELRARYLIAA